MSGNNKYISQGVRFSYQFKIYPERTEPELPCPECKGVGRYPGGFRTKAHDCEKCYGSGTINWHNPQVPEYLQHHMQKAWNEYWRKEKEARA